MHVRVYEPCSVKRGLNASSKIVEHVSPISPRRLTWDETLLVFIDFLHVKGPYDLMIYIVLVTESEMGKATSYVALCLGLSLFQMRFCVYMYAVRVF